MKQKNENMFRKKAANMNINIDKIVYFCAIIISIAVVALVPDELVSRHEKLLFVVLAYLAYSMVQGILKVRMGESPISQFLWFAFKIILAIGILLINTLFRNSFAAFFLSYLLLLVIAFGWWLWGRIVALLPPERS